MSNQRTRSPLRKVLVVAVMIACAAPLSAFADEERERALEARVAELERLVHELVAQKSAPAPAPAVKAADAKAAKPIQETTLTPGSAYANTSVKIGGFAKLGILATHTDGGTIADNSAGRILYVPGGIPVGGKSSSTLTDATAQLSRVNIGIDSKTDNGDKLGAFFEWDFFGGGNAATTFGSPVATNTYGLTVRHAYGYWNNWLAGQTWTNFMDPNALPETVDFIGPTDGTVFVRQAQIRYTDGGLSLALENPDTTVLPNGGGAITSVKRNSVPDFSARYTWKGDWGFFGVAGLVRQLRNETDTSHDSSSGADLSVMGRYNFGANDDIRFALSAGNALGRYVGLGSIGADAELTADGNVETRDAYAGYIAWRHAFDAQWRMNLTFAANHFSNDEQYTGTGATKRTQSAYLDFIYSPFPKLDLGAEYRHARRTLVSGADGDLNRLEFMAKYSF